MIASLLQALREPEYIHVLINPLPVYGLLIAIIGLVIALVQRSRRAQITALILIVLCALSVWPVVYFGEAGYDRALALADEQGQAWLKVHNHRADELAWLYYGLGLLAIVAIFLPRKWPKTANLLAIVTLLCSLGALAIGAYIGYAGGRIRHPEFRNGPAPAAPVEQDEH